MSNLAVADEDLVKTEQFILYHCGHTSDSTTVKTTSLVLFSHKK